jgi:hypothetical protein
MSLLPDSISCTRYRCLVFFDTRHCLHFIPAVLFEFRLWHSFHTHRLHAGWGFNFSVYMIGMLCVEFVYAERIEMNGA